MAAREARHTRVATVILLALAVTMAGCSAMVGKSVETADDPTADDNSWDPTRGLVSGTVYFDPDTIIESDRSTFVRITYSGTETRNVFDRRIDRYDDHNMHVFEASYEDLPAINAAPYSFDVVDVLVNTEFSRSAAADLAGTYARMLGQMPAMLRSVLEELVIHDGGEKWGGGPNYILIHHDYSVRIEDDNGEYLEEILMHEAGHSVLDFLAMTHMRMPWEEALAADDRFVSRYATDFPDREDATESFLAWFAIRYRSDRMTPELADWIDEAIPASSCTLTRSYPLKAPGSRLACAPSSRTTAAPVVQTRMVLCRPPDRRIKIDPLPYLSG